MDPFPEEPEHSEDVIEHALKLQKRFPRIGQAGIRLILQELHARGHPLSAAPPLLRLFEKHGMKVRHVLEVMPHLRRDPKEWARVLRESAQLGREFARGFPALGLEGDLLIRGEKSPHVEAMHAFSLHRKIGERLATMGFLLYRKGGRKVMLITNVQGTPPKDKPIKPLLDLARAQTGLPWPRLLGLVTLAHAERSGLEEVRGLPASATPFPSTLQVDLGALYDGTFRWLRFKREGEHWVKRPPFLDEKQRALLKGLGPHA